MSYDEFNAYLEQGVSIVTLAETLYVMQDEETMAAIREVDETPYDELELYTMDDLPW